MKQHLQHPTQTTACGMHHHQGRPLSTEQFDATASGDRCRRCQAVRGAQIAARPHHRSIVAAYENLPGFQLVVKTEKGESFVEIGDEVGTHLRLNQGNVCSAVCPEARLDDEETIDE